MATAAWQASGTLLGSTGADITPVIPAHQTNDILILLASSRVVTETCLTPAGGWAVLHGPTDVTAWRSYCFWLRAGSGAVTNPLLDWSAATGQKYGQVHTIRGAITTGSPFAASAFIGNLTNPIDGTGVTTTASNQLVIVACIASDNLSTTVTVTSTDPATYALNDYQDIITGNDAEGHFASQPRGAIGATGTVVNNFDAAMPAGTVLVAAILDQPLPYILQAPSVQASNRRT